MIHKKKLAILSARFPYPLNKGDKLRLFHQMKYLSQYFEIHLIAINDENIPRHEQSEVRRFCTSITLFNLNPIERAFGLTNSLIKKEPFQVGYFYSDRIKRQIAKKYKELKIDAVYCQLSRMAYYGLEFKGPVIFDYQDCFSKNYERTSQVLNGWKKLFYQREWKRMLYFEQFVHSSFVAKTIISSFDKEALPFESDNIHVIPNGVDAEHYAPQQLEKKYDLLFSGNLDYFPNKQAAYFIINDLLPALLKELPNIQVAIAGNTSDQKLVKSNHPNLTLLQNVEDMRVIYASSRFFLAPLFTGAGLQNKLLEAMSMGIPCISTSITNLSLGAKPTKEILIADKVEEFVYQSSELLKSAKKLEELALAGQMFVTSEYSWNKTNQKLLELIQRYL